MKKFDLIITLPLAILFVASITDAQRTNRIYRPCPGSTTPASVTLNTAGDVLFSPCSGRIVSTPAAAAFRCFLKHAVRGTLPERNPPRYRAGRVGGGKYVTE